MNDEITEPTVHLCWNESAIRRAAEVLRAAHLDIMAADVEAHLEPTIEEPTEFGSIVRAKFGGKQAELWTNTPWHGEHYWRTEGGWSAVWPELTDVEVLRTGVGEAESSEDEIDQEAAGAQWKIANWVPGSDSGQNVAWLNGFKAGLKAAGGSR